MPVIILGIFIIFLVFFVRKIRNRKRITKNSIVCFTGGLGSGKTYLGVKHSILSYKTALFWHYVKFWKKNREKPVLLSNIPLVYRPFLFSKRRFSEVLQAEHILMKKRIPPNSVIFIDEVGQFLDQYSYDNKFVMVDAQEFVRFFRHYVGKKYGRLILTDQSISNVTLQIKRRVNVIYNLNDFARYGFILPFGTCKVHELEMVEETVNQTDGVSDTSEYFFFFLPYKFQKRKQNYDTYCYSELYMSSAARSMPEEWKSLKAEGFIEMPYERYKRK